MSGIQSHISMIYIRIKDKIKSVDDKTTTWKIFYNFIFIFRSKSSQMVIMERFNERISAMYHVYWIRPLYSISFILIFNQKLTGIFKFCLIQYEA